MSNINSVIVVGNLTRDPETKSTRGGTSVLLFGIACNESKHNTQTGEWDEVPSFFDIVMYGKRAEGLSKFLAKGMKVTVAGRLSQRSWEKDGQRHSRVEIVANEVELPPRQRQQQDARGLTQENYDALAGVGVKPGDIEYAEEDLPF